MDLVSIEVALRGSDVHKRTTAKTEDFDMVSRLLGRESKNGGGKEHCLVIGMSYKEAYALVAKIGKGSPCDLGCV